MRNMRKMSAICSLLIAFLLVQWTWFAIPASPTPASPVLVSSGLINVHQLAVTDDGVLLFAEGGIGDSTDWEHNCIGHTDSVTCFGRLGSIGAIISPETASSKSPKRIFTRLLSSNGSGDISVVGVAGRKYYGGTVFFQMGYYPPEIVPSTLPSVQIGKLYYGRPGYGYNIASDVSKYEFAKDPDMQGSFSRPSDVLDFGDRRLVLDIDANSILSVEKSGHISPYYVFANVGGKQCQTFGINVCELSASTISRSLHDGDLLIGGSVNGSGVVIEMDYKTRVIERVITGFENVSGVAVDRDGSVYVGGSRQKTVTKVSTTGKRTSTVVPYKTNSESYLDLVAVGGLAVDSRNNVYALISGYEDDSSQIWRLRL